MSTTTRFSPAAGRRAAIVAGLRTPFLKSGTAFKKMLALDLGRAVVCELIARISLDPGEIDRIIYGQVVPTVEAPNIARELLLSSGLPRHIDAYSVTRACATSTQAFVNAAQAIFTGEADVVIAGGADSTSRPPITVSDGLADALMAANSAKDPMGKARALSRLHLKDLLPKAPALAERSTGLTMGQSCEKMAKENGISREAQDAFALRSHQRSSLAWEKGTYALEVMHLPVPPKFDEVVSRDGFPRADASLEKLAELKPAFDRKHGTITAGTSSPLTDGASALVVMSEEKAKALGYKPLAFLKSFAFAALDPAWQMLMGPSFATPLALERAGMTLKDIDLVDMHEAFAAQVLSNLQAFASKRFAEEHLGRSEAVGEVADDKLNIHGGSISLGHPFGATGARQLLTMARELDRRGGGTALVTQCAAGGLGAAVIIER
ncbi:MAG: acetyl-CoA C-acyltransferase FadI [Deltaproteobacteria bacterium]|nr:acetyl-CoA C-acyltransferase FadI [Deltaproteobacteria bacterium]